MADRPTLLLIDDDKGIQSLIRMVFTHEGYDTQISSDGHAALKYLAEAGTPGLILLDMLMPRMGGLEFVAAYHATPAPHAPIIILTANRPLQLPATLGVQDVLTKPFDLDHLIELVSKYAPVTR